MTAAIYDYKDGCKSEKRGIGRGKQAFLEVLIFNYHAMALMGGFVCEFFRASECSSLFNKSAPVINP
jgi:hypothetical protein